MVRTRSNRMVCKKLAADAAVLKYRDLVVEKANDKQDLLPTEAVGERG